MQSPKELFIHELTDMLDAERKLIDALGPLAQDQLRREGKVVHGERRKFYYAQTRIALARLFRRSNHLTPAAFSSVINVAA